MSDKWRFRIAIVNDYKNTRCFMDYKKFGVVMDFTAYIGTAVEKANDSIRIFHNYKKISTVKFKKEAIVEMDKLLDQAPDEAKAEFNHYKQEYLTNAII